MAVTSRSGSSSSRCLSAGTCDRCSSAAPMSAVVVSTPPPTVMNTIDSAVSRGMALAVDLVVRDRAHRVVARRVLAQCHLLADAHHHVAELGLRGAVLGGAARVRGHVVERVGDHAPVVFGEPEPLERDRAGDRHRQLVGELALPRFDELVDEVRGPVLSAWTQPLGAPGRQQLRQDPAHRVPVGRVDLLGRQQRQAALRRARSS